MGGRGQVVVEEGERLFFSESVFVFWEGGRTRRLHLPRSGKIFDG